MSHQFLLKLSTTSLLILGQTSVWPNSPVSGLIESFQNNISSVSKATKAKSTSQRRQILPADADIELTENQLKAILFYLPEYYSDLVLGNNCALYSFIQNGIVSINSLPVKELEVTIYSKEKAKRETALIPLEVFNQYYFKNKCRRVVEVSKQYTKELVKNTVAKVTPEIPKNKVLCQEQWDSWKKSDHIVQICSIHERLKLANKKIRRLETAPDKISLKERSEINSLKKEKDFYLTNLSDIHQVYYKNLCENLHNRDSFCSNYVSADFWSEIQNFEKPQYKVAWKCAALQNREELPKNISKSFINSCINKFRNNEDLCTAKGSKQDSALFPMPTCNQISAAQLETRLNNDYQDCPSKIKNTGIINIYRLLAHFNKGKVTKSKNNNDCVFPAFASVYELYQLTEEEEKWPLQICYVDKISKKERCTPFVPGNHPRESFAQNNVIGNILFQTKLNSTRPKCQTVTLDRYNPQRLKYKTGCWIIPENKNCQTYNCPQRVLLDNREILSFYAKGDLLFDYVKNKYNSKDQAMINRVLESYELKQKTVSSLTSARFFFDSQKKGLIHGVGCAEDLYPIQFKTTTLGQCTPLPFIVDSYIKDGINISFSLRTAIDDTHSPRIIQWPEIFSAVSKYSEFHPLKAWNLYGIY